METNAVVASYENYNEENRLTTDNARKVEFITTTRVFDEIIPKNSKILDCAAGTGIYSFYLAEHGYDVTALDITPRHVEFMKKELANKPYSINVAVNDARNLGKFKNESFEVVLCMGPLYHLTEENDRQQCLNECLRVLKKGGILISAYINRLFVVSQVTTDNFKYLDHDFIDNLVETGTLKSDDPMCFWTDAYFDKPEIIEHTYRKLNMELIDHVATDGVAIFLREKINNMNQSEFKIWCDCHYSTCREKSILGISNHGLIVGKK